MLPSLFADYAQTRRLLCLATPRGPNTRLAESVHGEEVPDTTFVLNSHPVHDRDHRAEARSDAQQPAGGRAVAHRRRGRQRTGAADLPQPLRRHSCRHALPQHRPTASARDCARPINGDRRRPAGRAGPHPPRPLRQGAVPLATSLASNGKTTVENAPFGPFIGNQPKRK